ncbi:hypothetical protein MFIFM68171_06710 [Madurella fahalii]|uniref:Uncharacterized protein n=1 Tax=Madurella fahalii TaxID=1157608 RepID=A0ABQ0GG11_9PEZI
MYFMSIVGKFQEFVRDALAANYLYHAAFENDELRFITAVLNLTEQFKRNFDSAVYRYWCKPAQAVRNSQDISDAVEVSPTPDSEAITDDDDKSEGITANDDALESYPELKDLIVTDWTTDQPAGDVMKWIG